MTPEEAIKILNDTPVEISSGSKTTTREYNQMLHLAENALEKQVAKKPIFWENKYYFSPSPNDDWGYKCPFCGNQDIDYPDHHCDCGQTLDWGDTE